LYAGGDARAPRSAHFIFKLQASNGGVWADMTARYRGGRYQPFEWTFPDFKDGRYDADLKAIREIFRRQVASRQRGRDDNEAGR